MSAPPKAQIPTQSPPQQPMFVQTPGFVAYCQPAAFLHGVLTFRATARIISSVSTLPNASAWHLPPRFLHVSVQLAPCFPSIHSTPRSDAAAASWLQGELPTFEEQIFLSGSKLQQPTLLQSCSSNAPAHSVFPPIKILSLVEMVLSTLALVGEGCRSQNQCMQSATMKRNVAPLMAKDICLRDVCAICHCLFAASMLTRQGCFSSFAEGSMYASLAAMCQYW